MTKTTTLAVVTALLTAAAYAPSSYAQDLASDQAYCRQLIDEYTIRFVTKEPYFLNESVLGENISVMPRHYYDPENLLENVAIERPNQVWAADLTYLPMAHGFLYLMAILDVASRKVLAWRVSNTMNAEFCVAALKEALRKFGAPEIFNTDQGSQFTCEDWITPLKASGIAISMDGKGRWIDNVFIERLWRSVKYEDVYLHAYTSGSEARRSLTRYFSFYNARRVHEALSYATPDEIYLGELATTAKAA